MADSGKSEQIECLVFSCLPSTESARIISYVYKVDRGIESYFVLHIKSKYCKDAHVLLLTHEIKQTFSLIMLMYLSAKLSVTVVVVFDLFLYSYLAENGLYNYKP